MSREIRPETKIVLYILFVVSLFTIQGIRFYLITGVVVCLFCFTVPFRRLKSGWVPISLFLLFTFFSNVLGRHGKVLFSAGPLMLTEEGIAIAGGKTLRVLYMIAGVKVLMASTGTDEAISGFGRLLSPLERLGIPVKEFFHTMGLTLKCFPVLKNAAAEAYRENMRAADVKGFRQRARVISGFLLPLFVKSIESPQVFFEKEGKANEK